MENFEILYPGHELSEIPKHLIKLLPKNKTDVDTAQKVVESNYHDIEFILPHLMVWLQDMNWPVAQVLAPMFANIGKPLAPIIASILKSNDEIWKYWVLTTVVDVKGLALANDLQNELHELLLGDNSEGVPLIAERILNKL